VILWARLLRESMSHRYNIMTDVSPRSVVINEAKKCIPATSKVNEVITIIIAVVND